MELNGGSVVAMVGKDCVAIASDLRLGQQSVSLAHKFEKVRVLRRRRRRGGTGDRGCVGAREDWKKDGGMARASIWCVGSSITGPS
jgi:hypothetical protein